MSIAEEQAVSPACASCKQPLTGRYCSKCGEETLDPHSLTVRHFVSHTLLHEVAHVDGKILRTLRALLFRPGFLTAEYVAGRRRLYLNPLRLLITAIIVYALLTRGGFLFTLRIATVVLSVAPVSVPHGSTIEETVRRIDRYGVLQSILDRKDDAGKLTVPDVEEKFNSKLEKVAEPLSFANVVLLACALFLLFHRKRHLFVEHGVFSMHVVSFVLISSIAFLPGLWLLSADNDIGLVVVLVGVVWQFAYLAVAIRRFYFPGQFGWRFGVLASVAAVFLYILNSAFLTGVQMLGGAWALWSI